MDELYRWFLHYARLGWSLLDSVARAATRWAQYPAHLVYNAGMAAYSSFYTAQYLSSDMGITLDTILQNGSSLNMEIGRNYSPRELVDYFPSLVGEPYSGRVLTVTGEETTGSYGIVDQPFSTGDTLTSFYDKLYKTLGRMQQCDKFTDAELRLEFVYGKPRIVPYWGM
jgi:hypothetical protein